VKFNVEKLEKLAGHFPKGLKHPIVQHLASIRDLFTEGRLEAARNSTDPAVKREAAASVVNACVTLCTAIGTEPIPLADFPILTSLQVSMVAAIIYISGKKVSRKMAAEFIAALGVNVGAGLVLREGSRALLKLFPGWGNAISGAIAGAGTYAVGRASAAYFIDGKSMGEAKKLFHHAKPPPLPGL
jgi:uncharacterized protein (DUF697 family)